MYLAPKRKSFSWGLRLIIAIFLFSLFLWVGGGYFFVSFWMKIDAFIPDYVVAPSVSDELLLVRSRLSDVERERDVLAGRIDGRRGVLATVSISPGFFFGDAMILGVGSAGGIGIGHVVTTEDGVVLGTIDHVESGWSSVLLLSRAGSKTTLRFSASENTATSTPTKNILSEADGVGGGELKIDLPVSLSILPGSVVWWGERPEYPIGIVDRIDQSPARQIESVYVRLPMAPSSIHRVIVIP